MCLAQSNAPDTIARSKQESEAKRASLLPRDTTYYVLADHYSVSIPAAAEDTTSLNFKDADLRDVFRAMAYRHGVNIFLDNSVNKRVTIALNSVRVYDAIKFLCERNDLVLRVQGGIITVTLPPPPPKPLPPPRHVPVIVYERGLLSVASKDDDIEALVLAVQEKSGKNILVLGGTTGTVSGRLIETDFDQGFTQLMNSNGFALQKKNNIYAVSRLDYFVGKDASGTSQKSTPYWVSVKDSLVTLDVTGAPINRVVSDMIRQLNTDVVYYNDLTGTVTARATSVVLADALDLILRNSNYTYKETNGVYFVGEKTNKALIAAQLHRLKYLSAEQNMESIPQSILSLAQIKLSKEHNGFVLVASHDIQEQFQEYLNEIDKPVAQVLIEALVVDYDITVGSDFGIEAGLSGSQDTTGYNRKGTLWPGVNMKFNGTAVNNMLKQAKSISLFGKEINLANLGVLPADFYLNLKAMEQQGIANVTSKPLIATLNGHKASLSVGTTQYFLLKTTTPYVNQLQTVFQESQTFQTIEADVKMEITPYVGSNGNITVEIKPDFRTPVGAFSSDVPPTISKRSMSSTLIMREGETIVLGGLVQETESETSTRVPIVGSIPFIGKLFSSTSKSKRKGELLIYITPHISYGEAFKSAYSKMPGE
jgi:type IV pilus assembly protein PilQ